MAIVKARPRFPALTTDFDRMLDRMFGETPFFERETMETTWAPNLDMTESDDEYLVRCEVPGIPKENLDVTLDGNVMTLSGRREFRKEEETEKYIWRERQEGRFVRSLRLPTKVAENEIDATVHDGILTVHLKKTEPTVKSKIVIK